METVSGTTADDILRVGDLVLNKTAHRVHRQKRDVHLSPTEYRLLMTMMAAPGSIFAREELHRILWGGARKVDVRAVDLSIARLRKQISLGKDDAIITTVRGQGYVLGDF
jgi:two-component system phosphate regulon response regulator PhoB